MEEVPFFEFKLCCRNWNVVLTIVIKVISNGDESSDNLRHNDPILKNVARYV